MPLSIRAHIASVRVATLGRFAGALARRCAAGRTRLPDANWLILFVFGYSPFSASGFDSRWTPCSLSP